MSLNYPVVTHSLNFVRMQVCFWNQIILIADMFNFMTDSITYRLLQFLARSNKISQDLLTRSCKILQDLLARECKILPNLVTGYYKILQLDLARSLLDIIHQGYPKEIQNEDRQFVCQIVISFHTSIALANNFIYQNPHFISLFLLCQTIIDTCLSVYSIIIGSFLWNTLYFKY